MHDAELHLARFGVPGGIAKNSLAEDTGEMCIPFGFFAPATGDSYAPRSLAFVVPIHPHLPLLQALQHSVVTQQLGKEELGLDIRRASPILSRSFHLQPLQLHLHDGGQAASYVLCLTSLIWGNAICLALLLPEKVFQ